MDTKEQLIQELDNVSEPVLMEVLDFLQFLKAKAEQDVWKTKKILQMPV